MKTDQEIVKGSNSDSSSEPLITFVRRPKAAKIQQTAGLCESMDVDDDSLYLELDKTINNLAISTSVLKQSKRFAIDDTSLEQPPQKKRHCNEFNAEDNPIRSIVIYQSGNQHGKGEVESINESGKGEVVSNPGPDNEPDNEPEKAEMVPNPYPDNEPEKAEMVSNPEPDNEPVKGEIVSTPAPGNESEKEVKQVKKIVKAKALSTCPGLETRTSPFKLLQLFNSFNNAKKACFKKCALGHFLDLAIGRLPKYYAHYVVSQFKHRSLKIDTAEGSSFRVCAKNVKLTLGLPMGPRSMLELPSGVSYDRSVSMIKKWSVQFGRRVKKGKKKTDITMSELKALILSTKDEDLGPDFIRNVLLYIINALIWSPGSDSVYLDPIPYLEDVDKVHEFNWCEYVIDKLILAGEKWSPGSPYCGPLLFLIIHFSDMVVDAKRTVKRTTPRFLAWSTQTLNAREKRGLDHGFGYGFIADEEEFPGEAGVVEVPKVRKKKKRVRGEFTTTLEDNVKKSQAKENPRVNPIESTPILEDIVQESQPEENPRVNPTVPTLIVEDNVEKSHPEENPVDSTPTPETNSAKLLPKETPPNIEFKDAVLFNDYIKSIETMASAISNYEAISRTIVATMPDHRVLSNLVSKSRDCFQMPVIVNDASQETPVEEDKTEDWDSLPLSQDTFWDQPEQVKRINEIFDELERAKKFFQPPASQVDLTPPSFDLGISENFQLEKERPLPDCQLGDTNDQGELKGTEKDVNDDGHAAEEKVEDVVGGENERVRLACEPEVNEIRKGVLEEERAVEVEDDEHVASKELIDAHKANEEQVVTGETSQRKEDPKEIKVGNEPDVFDPTQYNDHDDTPQPLLKIKLKNPSQFERSPYMVRILDAKSSPSGLENDLADFLLSNDLLKFNKFFEYQTAVVNNEDFGSLVKDKTCVEANVISGYAALLNYKEKFRSNDSPSRMFLPLHVMGVVTGFADVKKRNDRFMEDMNYYMSLWTDYKKPSEIDLFFFPFYLSEHYVVICVNVMTRRIDVLDNSSNQMTPDPLVKYNGFPDILQDVFVAWMKASNMKEKSKSMAKVKITRPKLKWSIPNNYTCCGVYVMRHMETYFGKVTGYESGLTVKAAKLLYHLRIKYAYDFINFQGNKYREEVFGEMHKYFEKLKEK